MSNFDKELDTSGLGCPLPIIKAKKEINTMESGQILHGIYLLLVYNFEAADNSVRSSSQIKPYCLLIYNMLQLYWYD